MQIDDMDTYALKCALISLTGLRNPRLLDNWDHLLVRGEFGARVKVAFDRFHDSLIEMHVQVRDRNEKRGKPVRGTPLPFQAFNPMVLESSVSV
jgi:hypothetical protein